MQELQKLFRMAGQAVTQNPLSRLINENRDTLFYMGLSVGYGIAVTHGHHQLANNLLRAGGERELVRVFSWHPSPWQRPIEQYAGANLKSINPLKNRSAAIYVMAFTAVLAEVLVRDIIVPTTFMAGLFQFWLNDENKSSLRKTLELYFDKDTGMWNWPSKKGGGTTQTQKFIDGFKNLGARLAAPRLQPIPIPVRNFTAQPVLEAQPV